MTGTVVVLGAGGLLGRAVVRRLRAEAGTRVVAVGRRAAGLPRPAVRCDLASWEETAALFRRLRPAWVFHCAGTTDAGPWERLRGAHVDATLNVLEAARRLPSPPRIVVAGSAAEYGDVPAARQPIRETQPPRPSSPYGLSKLCQSTLCGLFARLGAPVVVGRVFNVVAPDAPESSAVGRFASLLRAVRPGGRVRTASLDAVRDLLTVDDAADALIALARRGRAGEIYNICAGKGVRMREVFGAMARCVGRVRVEETAADAGRTAAAACVGSPAKIRRDTGWRPRRDWRDALPVVGPDAR